MLERMRKVCRTQWFAYSRTGLQSERTGVGAVRNRRCRGGLE